MKIKAPFELVHDVRHTYPGDWLKPVFVIFTQVMTRMGSRLVKTDAFITPLRELHRTERSAVLYDAQFPRDPVMPPDKP